MSLIKWVVLGLFVFCLCNAVISFMVGHYFSSLLNFGLAYLNWYNFKILRC
jgi:hypothetical protein